MGHVSYCLFSGFLIFHSSIHTSLYQLLLHAVLDYQSREGKINSPLFRSFGWTLKVPSIHESLLVGHLTRNYSLCSIHVMLIDSDGLLSLSSYNLVSTVIKTLTPSTNGCQHDVTTILWACRPGSYFLKLKLALRW